MTLLKRISQRLLEHTSVMPYYWVILFVATGSQVTISFVNQGIATLAPFFVRDLGLNMTQVGFLCGAVNIGMAFTLLLVGVLVDRFGEKVVLIAGGILTGLTMLAASRANSFAALAVLLLIAGFWVASATPAGSKGIMSWFPV
ncbi:MAG TPA: MFS transporter, partial [Pelotomaculum sp.]|nr:MFS transporter [Pelotomaculum sp.]